MILRVTNIDTFTSILDIMTFRSDHLNLTESKKDKINIQIKSNDFQPPVPILLGHVRYEKDIRKLQLT